MKEGSVEVAAKQASEATDTAFYRLPVEPGGDSKHAPDPCLFGSFVVHDSHETTVSLVPPTVVGFRETITGNVRCDAESRNV